MKPENCPYLNRCHKIEMILDKDLPAFLYADFIRDVCADCTQRPVRITKPKRCRIECIVEVEKADKATETVQAYGKFIEKISIGGYSRENLSIEDA